MGSPAKRQFTMWCYAHARNDVESVWQGKKRGKTSSSGGGGDYAAQMLLGHMKRAGLVRHAPSEGSTRWEVTPLGRAEAAK